MGRDNTWRNSCLHRIRPSQFLEEILTSCVALILGQRFCDTDVALGALNHIYPVKAHQAGTECQAARRTAWEVTVELSTHKNFIVNSPSKPAPKSLFKSDLAKLEQTPV